MQKWTRIANDDTQNWTVILTGPTQRIQPLKKSFAQAEAYQCQYVSIKKQVQHWVKS